MNEVLLLLKRSKYTSFLVLTTYKSLKVKKLGGGCMAGSVYIVNAGPVVVNKNQKRMQHGGRPGSNKER